MNLIEEIRCSLLSFIDQNLLATHDKTKKHELLLAIELTINVDVHKQQFGDLSTNAPLMLARELGAAPRDIAQKIINGFKHAAIERYEVAGAGFINFFLTKAALIKLADALWLEGDKFFKLDQQAARHQYSIEFVSANPTGPLHIGNGRGGIIGDVLGNILAFIGHKVTKEYYINDAGVQVQKLGLSFKIRCQQALGVPVAFIDDGYHGEYLIELAKQCVKQHGPDLLENPEVFFANYAKEFLLRDIEETLKKYGIVFDVWFSELSLHQSGAIEHALKILEHRGYLYEKEGALWFKATEFGDDKDRVLRKSSGELTYFGPEVAYLENKFDRGFDQLVIVLGQDHHSYVSRMEAVVRALGHKEDQLECILYQLVTLKEDGEILRMSKRAGHLVTLREIIDTVGTDVARFFYLNKKADAHLELNIDLALKQTDENPVFYIQYAYVRIKSILEKACGQEPFKDINHADCEFIAEPEKMLIKKIVSLKILLHSINRNYHTHLLTYYVIELAQVFHRYYGEHRVIDMSNLIQSRGRLFMITLVQRTFKLCFDILGISAPEQM